MFVFNLKFRSLEDTELMMTADSLFVVLSTLVTFVQSATLSDIIYIASQGIDSGNCNTSIAACLTWDYAVTQIDDNAGDVSILVDPNTTLSVGTVVVDINASYTITGSDTGTISSTLELQSTIQNETLLTIERGSVDLENLHIDLDQTSNTQLIVSSDGESQSMTNVVVTNFHSSISSNNITMTVATSVDSVSFTNTRFENGNGYKSLFEGNNIDNVCTIV